VSDRFHEANKNLLAERLKAGYIRDCHGDLHSRNIFLLHTPQVFDCIEFNDDYRQIDVLNDIAFLCMDLDAFGRKDFSDFFLDCYDQLFSTIKTAQDRKLLIYYKSYRANIRAKVNSLRARSAKSEDQKKIALSETEKYLLLMQGYLQML
jgi:aminoglycoside phosphotransferase family enzyme